MRNPMPQELSPPPYSEYYDYSYEYYDYYEDADGDNDLDPWGFTSGQSVGAGNMGAGMGSMAPQHGHMCPDVGYTLARGVIMSALHADSTVECHSRCLSERACVSWSWVDPQRAVDRDDLGMCYLKYECDLSTLHFTDNGLWDGWPGCQVRDSGLADVFHGWVCPGAGYEYVGGRTTPSAPLRRAGARRCVRSRHSAWPGRGTPRLTAYATLRMVSSLLKQLPAKTSMQEHGTARGRTSNVTQYVAAPPPAERPSPEPEEEATSCVRLAMRSADCRPWQHR